MSPDVPLSAAQLFDTLGVDYERAYAELPEQHAALDWLRGRLRAGARVLDVGSGTGIPTARILSDSGFRVEGIDVSPVMIELARQRVPAATFHRADVREFSAEPASFDAICAFFPLLQMPRADIDAALVRIATWLRPGGYLVAATVPVDAEQADIVFMGHPARVSSYAAADFVARLGDAGLEVVEARESTFRPDHEDALPEPHLFVYCRRPD
ncbi:methyltransferase domain-containing protein [Nocardia sp. CDC159]|uniref:Methyltransferase domain-containing protein n=1 Tax=Nocardia pulmonis TaxID=2951408 RepID=A0A9X2EGF5_9NOCA|nr:MULTISPECIES: class I SAM-dependent methyltransferase [Nocardia]MCM6777856.1 methyltransferase domain-containing protein [Nocardia pulmonis]MCM6790740.1 methyltransferase domain-containing protein [Nocardia sp. CDC159]